MSENRLMSHFISYSTVLYCCIPAVVTHSCLEMNTNLWLIDLTIRRMYSNSDIIIDISEHICVGLYILANVTSRRPLVQFTMYHDTIKTYLWLWLWGVLVIFVQILQTLNNHAWFLLWIWTYFPLMVFLSMAKRRCICKIISHWLRHCSAAIETCGVTEASFFNIPFGTFLYLQNHKIITITS